MSMNSNNVLMRLVKDVNTIKASLRRVVSNLPLYDIANENSPAALSTDQNNYNPGNYDILRLNPTTDITISGFLGGVKGRFLEILNVGTGRITYPDGSLSSDAANRFNLPYDNNVTQLPNARVRFYYDSTQQRWTLSDSPNIQGPFGKVSILKHTSVDNAISTISASSYNIVKPNTVDSDVWGYWDATNGRFVIPTGESGLYSLSINFYWLAVGASSDWAAAAYISVNGNPSVSDIHLFTQSNLFNDKTGYGYADVNGTVMVQMESGDTIEVNVYQAPAAAPDKKISTYSPDAPVFVFSKIG